MLQHLMQTTLCNGGWWHVMLAQPLPQWKAGCPLLELLYTSVTGSEQVVFRNSKTSLLCTDLIAESNTNDMNVKCMLCVAMHLCA